MTIPRDPHEPGQPQDRPERPGQEHQPPGQEPGHEQPAQPQYPPPQYPPPQYPPPTFGTMPAPPDAEITPGMPAKRPRTVTAAGVLWIIVGIGSMLGGIAFFLAAGGNQMFYSQIAAQFGGDVPSSTLLGIGLVTVVVGALYIVLGVLVLRARNWARITVTVLGVIAMLGLNIVTFVLVVVALVLQYLPASNAYFRAAKQAR